jgi:hypothetical protein
MAELAVHCFDGADETGGSCVGGGGGKGLEAALGAGPALAVCVLETDPTWPTGFGAGYGGAFHIATAEHHRSAAIKA